MLVYQLAAISNRPLRPDALMVVVSDFLLLMRMLLALGRDEFYSSPEYQVASQLLDPVECKIPACPS